MTKSYKDYYWKNGLPYGIQLLSNPLDNDLCYKIVHDPYRKWVSVEKYRGKTFCDAIYDSRLLNFRKLSSAEQVGWQREKVFEEREKTICLIRNQDDRVVYFETLYFSKQRCCECHIHSPQKILLSIHVMSYQDQDPFNGVTLFDANRHPVMLKKYRSDEQTGEFTEMIEEIWQFSQRSAPCCLPLFSPPFF